MSKKQDTHRSQPAEAGDRTNLDGQYHRIGISAVAAALPFVSKTKDTQRGSARSEEKQGFGGRKRSVLSI